MNLKNRSSETIKLFYYYSKKNFGDQLNLIISEKIFNKKVELSHPYYCKYTMIGSILEPFILHKKNFRNIVKKNIFPPVKIFGSGFLAPTPSSSEEYIRKLHIDAVRGRLTRDRFAKHLNKNLDHICLGDPGLLTSILVKNNIQKKYSVGIIAHMANANDRNIIKLKEKIPESILINMLDDAKKIIQQISSCEIILSNTMHGLIVADSFGIPNKRLLLQNDLIGGDYKFIDYYSAFDLELQNTFDLRIENSYKELSAQLNKVKKEYNIHYDQVIEIQENLLKAAPF